MAKYNTSRKTNSNVTINYEGAKAYKNSPKRELLSLVSTCILQDMFYETADDRIERVKNLVKEISKKDSVFIAKLAAFARNELYLRTIPIILIAELAENHNGDDLLRRMVNATIQRPDEMTELLAYVKVKYGVDNLGSKAISKQMKLGLSDKFHYFDEYQFTKYKGERKNVSIRDVMFLVHPRPIDEKEKILFNKIAKNELKNTNTWEAKLSEAGKTDDKQKEITKKEEFEKMIDSGKMGYMATLRNLRNFVKVGVSNEHLIKVHEYLINENAVKNSKQLPFRFYSAYNALKNSGLPNSHIFFKSLEKAMSVSTKNIKGFNKNDKVLIVCDLSGSMDKTISKSDINLKDIGIVLGSSLNSSLNFCDVAVFANNFEYVDNLIPNNIIQNINIMRKKNVGGGTEGYKIFKNLIVTKKVYDKIVIFTDEQMYSEYNNNWAPSVESLWKEYLRDVNPEAKIIFFNLAGYGNSPIKINDHNVIEVSGWSEKIFDILDLIQDTEKFSSIIDNVVLESYYSKKNTITEIADDNIEKISDEA